MFVVVKEVRASAGFMPLPNGDHMPLGFSRMELPSLGSGEALLALKGSDVSNLRSRGQACRACALGVG
jgi:hypothetical protein